MRGKTIIMYHEKCGGALENALLHIFPFYCTIMRKENNPNISGMEQK